MQVVQQFIDLTLNYVFKLGIGFVFSFPEKTNNSLSCSEEFQIQKIISKCTCYQNIELTMLLL